MPTETTIAKAKLFLSAAASIAASAMLLRSITQEYFPHEFEHYFSSKFRRFLHSFSNQLTIVIDEFDGLHNNQIYQAAEIYLGSKISPSTKRIKVTKPEKEKNFTVTMESNQEIVDFFEGGVKLNWVLVTRQVEAKSIYNPRENNYMIRSQSRSFELSFHKKYKEKVLNSYLPYVLKESKSMKHEKKTLKIFTVDHDNIYGDLSHAWTPVNLDHPAKFETLAMEFDVKKSILEDLERFVKRRDFYRKVGKAWKRGYLLYGPPGTGKSSLIAAMANYLNFDIYDLELSGLRCNSELRRLLLATANKSILVVEDIDCTIELEDRKAEARAAQPQRFRQENQVTLSGLLNFIDGLWSSIGDERIIIFTTNHKEKLDPALLRPGRMDVHIHMSYCTPCGFRLLASNYLKLTHHPLFENIEAAIQTTEVTPAELAEQLMRHEDPDVVLRDVITFIEEKKVEIEEAKAKKLEEKEANKEIESEEKVGGVNGLLSNGVIQV